MTLLERCNTIARKVGLLASMEQSRIEFMALQARAEEVTRAAAPLHRNLGVLREYRSAGLAVGLPKDECGAVGAAVHETRVAFERAPQSSTLVSGHRWVQLIKSLQEAASRCAAANGAAWQVFVSTECVFELPSEIEHKAVPTADNIGLLERYKKQYSDLADLTRNSATTEAAVRAVRGAALALRKTYEGLKLNLPADVAAFLAAANSPLGISLEAASPTILKWLRDHGMLGKFFVRRRI